MKRAAKVVGLAVLGLAVMVSLAFNASYFYKSYTSTLKAAGYNEAMQIIDATLAQQGKLELTRRKPDGSLEKVVLVEEKEPDAQKAKK